MHPPHVIPAVVLAVDAIALRSLRLQAALSQKDLARAAGIARVTVSRLETGKPASPNSVKRIANALGVTVASFAKVVHE